MLKVVILILVCFPPSIKLIYSNWYGIQHPHQNLYAVYFIDDNTGFFGGQNGSIKKTTNGGLFWREVEINNKFIRSINFINSVTGWAAVTGSGFGSTAILKTTNSGENWFSITFPVTTILTSIYFCDELTGWTCSFANGSIYETTNGGNNWSENGNFPTGWSRIQFINGQTGWAAGAHLVMKTTDGGVSWSDMTPNPPDSYYYSISFVNSNTGWCCGYRGTNQGVINYTTNGGVTWQPQYLNNIYSFESIDFTDHQNGGSVTIRQIFSTTNSGLNWLENGFTSFFLFRSIDFSSLNVGYIGGGGGQILKTTNRGVNWNFSLSGIDPSYNAVEFANQSTGYSCGNDGVIIKSVDGGERWSMTESGTNLDFNSLSFVNTETGFVAGDSGKILKTSDGGLNWVNKNANITDNISSLDFINVQTGWACAENGKIIKSTDSGNTWFLLNSDTQEDLFSIIFPAGNSTGWACGNNGTIIKTSNGGLNWISQNTLTSRSIKSLSFININTGYAAGDSGLLIRTINGGNNWNTVQMPYTNDLNCVFLIDSINCVAVGDLIVLKNINSEFWGTQSIPGTTIKNSVYFFNSLTGIIVGEQGGIYKTTDGGGVITKVKNIGNSIPAKLLLSQNYPNPFNPITHFGFRIADFGLVKLTIYDALGKEVEVLLNRELQPGIYEAEWDASTYPSGVYYYKLESGDFKETRKMVLIK